MIRRAVPLALAILSASNPQLSIIDTLSKLSHDNDTEVAHNSIFSMGIVGAGPFLLIFIDFLKSHRPEILSNAERWFCIYITCWPLSI